MAVTSVCLSSDEGTMYTGGKDCAVIRWDVETGKKDVYPGGRNKFECGAHFEKVLSLCLLEQRGLLVSAGVDRLAPGSGTALGPQSTCQEWQFTFDDYSCRLSLVRPNLMATDFPTRPRQHWLAARLNRDHQGSYLILNLSGAIYDTCELQGPVMDVVMSGCVLPLEVLLRLIVSVHQWLSRATKNVVVAHGADAGTGSSTDHFGPGAYPVVLIFACYLSWVGKADHPKEAMLEVCRRMGISKSLCPSQLRYLSYFELLQRGKLDLWSHPARLARVVLIHVGSEDRERALEVWKQDILIFRTNVSEDDDVCHTSAIHITSSACGDLSVRLVTRRTQVDDGAVGDWELEFQVCFHTALVALAGGLSRFPAMELDGRERGALPEGCAVDVFVENIEPVQEAEEGSSAAAAAQGPKPAAPEGAQFFDLSADDDAVVEVPPSRRSPSRVAVFAPEDIDAFFEDL
ncbi:unnamed protein product [Effrenium voratum]|uniref:Uncharacterized protein n=1 Tax=Effrenium voratum TaxID=2562239 RepID=A0AA36NNB1_9DINO|nr:unnamed protein product [Effrenium voratum]